jgi:hypothetical protein
VQEPSRTDLESPSPAVDSKRPKVEPIRDPTLFQMEKLTEAGKLANNIAVERPATLRC